MYRIALMIALTFVVLADSPSERIGVIDFYGLGDLDANAMRALLPVREGDRIPPDDVANQALRRIIKTAGRQASLSWGCCLPDGRSQLYVGFAEPGAPTIKYNPQPAADLKLPDEVIQIFTDFETHWNEGVEKGDATEDDSQGYALGHYPPLRTDQLKLKEWARANTDTVFRVLAESRSRKQRAYAAWAMSYAERSPQQISALVRSAFDVDSEVRNNSVRALDTLCAVGPEVTRQIPAEKFLSLLHSLTWSDRNKGSLLLAAMTESRDPDLLKLLHDQALTPLREMARWKNRGHASASLEILGRMAGIEETRLTEMIQSNPGDVLKAVH